MESSLNKKKCNIEQYPYPDENIFLFVYLLPEKSISEKDILSGNALVIDLENQIQRTEEFKTIVIVARTFEESQLELVRTLPVGTKIQAVFSLDEIKELDYELKKPQNEVIKLGNVLDNTYVYIPEKEDTEYLFLSGVGFKEASLYLLANGYDNGLLVKSEDIEKMKELMIKVSMGEAPYYYHYGNEEENEDSLDQKEIF
ncbi:TPA: hypothetical protein NV714_002664 [Escherichia coli]|nr:hypothetical protein [Escherichia coli]